MLIKTIKTMFPVAEYKIDFIDGRKYLLTCENRLLAVRSELREVEMFLDNMIKKCSHAW